MFTVIAFDISDDRTRYRVVELLREYAVRVQKSVFEAAMLPPPELQRLRERVDSLIDPETDRVRYYVLCGACVPRIIVSGQGGVTPYEEFTIV